MNQRLRNRESSYLLPKHDNPGCESCAPISLSLISSPFAIGGRKTYRHGEELNELREEILSLIGLALQLDTDVCIVRVPGGLQIGRPQASEGPICFLRVPVLNVPSLEN